MLLPDTTITQSVSYRSGSSATSYWTNICLQENHRPIRVWLGGGEGFTVNTRDAVFEASGQINEGYSPSRIS